MKINAIILAAGSSSRMGQSKQLLRWGNQSLLRHAVATALNADVSSVFVVLGHNEDAHRSDIKDLDVTTVTNEQWQQGMGSSLKAGLKQATQNADGILLMVCDQPMVSTDHLNVMIDEFKKTQHTIVASQYQDTIGVPALFAKELIGELMNIPDNHGARNVIAKHRDNTYLVQLASGADVDTPEDYKRLTQPGSDI